jgi:hypothetical protein
MPLLSRCALHRINAILIVHESLVYRGDLSPDRAITLRVEAYELLGKQVKQTVTCLTTVPVSDTNLKHTGKCSSFMPSLLNVHKVNT